MVIGNEFDHEVKRCSAASRCDPVPINDKHRFGKHDIFEFFGKAVLVFPMDRGFFAVEQTRFGHRKSSRTKPCNCDPAPCFAAQPVQNAFCRGFLHIDTTTQHNCVVTVQFYQIIVDFERAPVRANSIFAAFGHDFPCVKLFARSPVRDTQAFNRSRKAQHCKVIHERENKTTRLAGMVYIDNMGF